MARIRRTAIATLLIPALLVVIAWAASAPAPPGDFGHPPVSSVVSRGALLRHEPFDLDLPAAARGWRILYGTRRADGTPAVATAIVVRGGRAGAGPAPSASAVA